jgi:hypothetical protein
MDRSHVVMLLAMFVQADRSLQKMSRATFALVGLWTAGP